MDTPTLRLTGRKINTGLADVKLNDETAKTVAVRLLRSLCRRWLAEPYYLVEIPNSNLIDDLLNKMIVKTPNAVPHGKPRHTIIASTIHVL